MEQSVGGAAVPYSAPCLAYVGDAVFELLVREMLLKGGSRPVHALNESARAYVTAVAQGALYHRVFPFLTEEEQGVMRRGRNLHGTSRVRRADMSEYRHATGLEALFGYLHLHGRRERINEIFALCTEGADGEKA